MGHSGFCRVRPVHVAGLLKRYCQLLGQRRHVQTLGPKDANQLAPLEEAISALAAAIRVFKPDIALSALRPIAYRDSEPLPKLALMRAVLAALRTSKDGYDLDSLVDAVVKTHGLSFGAESEAKRFTNRVGRTAKRLATRQVIKCQDGRFSI